MCPWALLQPPGLASQPFPHWMEILCLPSCHPLPPYWQLLSGGGGGVQGLTQHCFLTAFQAFLKSHLVCEAFHGHLLGLFVPQLTHLANEGGAGSNQPPGLSGRLHELTPIKPLEACLPACFWLFLSFFLSFFWQRCVACGQPGVEPMLLHPPALEARSLNHWTTREVPSGCFR